MGRRGRQRAAKGSASMLLLLIIAAAALAFIPMRVTLATGTSSISLFFQTDILYGLAGSHLTADALGLFLNTTFATVLFPGGSIPLVSIGGSLISFPLGEFQFFAVKAQRISVDITNSEQIGLWNLPYVTPPTPRYPIGIGEFVQLRVTVLSMTIAGYVGSSSVTNRYGEAHLAGLNPAIVITFDRFFLDLFIDPIPETVTYVVSADMTVYQAIAILAEAAFL